MNCQPLLLSFDNAKVRTFFEYPNFSDKKIRTFLHFVCKCLKINTLHRQKIFIPVKRQKRAKKDGRNARFTLSANVPLFRILRAVSRV